MPDAEPISIVLTGGPGAGKTTIARRLADDDAFAEWRAKLGGVLAVPEAATQVYESRRTRWDRLDLAGRLDVQRAIYALQRDQEDRLRTEAARRGQRVLLLDRGTIDGSAYWPDGAAAYWNDLGTTAAEELARYRGVVLLESVAALGAAAYDGDASNAVRFESADAALESGRLLQDLWSDHPRSTVVRAHPNLDEKVHATADAVAHLAK